MDVALYLSPWTEGNCRKPAFFLLTDVDAALLVSFAGPCTGHTGSGAQLHRGLMLACEIDCILHPAK